MGSTIQIKRSSANTLPSGLYLGELAYTWAPNNQRLFIGTGGDVGDGVAGSMEIIGGKYFTDKLDHTPGVLTANSALIVDDSGKIDVLNASNIFADGSVVFTGSVRINGVFDVGGNVNFESFATHGLFANTASIDLAQVVNLNVATATMSSANVAVLHATSSSTQTATIESATVRDLVVIDPIQTLDVVDLTILGTFKTDDISSNNVSIYGALNVLGAITSLDDDNLKIEDSIVTLNTKLAGDVDPTQSSGFVVNRGSHPDVSLLWDESDDLWSFGQMDVVANSVYAHLVGNADTTTRLRSPITFTLANTVTGEVTFDGSDNVTIQTSVHVIYGGTY